MEKTNAIRILDKNKINYKTHSYVHTDAISGIEAAAALNQNPDHVFKTLVTTAKSRQHYVFMIPVAKELDLKKAAASVNEKSVEMLKLKDLFPLTGYVHGGCSPIGMKKVFTTVIDSSAQNYETIIFSAGKIGYQIETSLGGLQKIINIRLADIII
ncbi:MAG: Cys-tRNA(Pro) deacylase [Endomicrobiaceae bacterium]